MITTVNSLGLQGVNGYLVKIECFTGPGTAHFEVVGLPDAAVREARDRVRAAIHSLGLEFPRGRITINLAPADIHKEGSFYDLPILLALLTSSGQIPELPPHAAFIGELSLDAHIRQTAGMLPMAIAAEKLGIRELFCPHSNAVEASIAKNLTVYPVETVTDLLAHIQNYKSLTPQPPWENSNDSYANQPDLADVRGQHKAKLALMLAAAGGHHLILSGPPGTGKSMLASRIGSIMPPLTREESIETSIIHSIAGILPTDSPLITSRPFRSPHHSISVGGLAGGGRIPHPGELSLAHNGVLFLDELPEFAPDALEVLRQPIETGEITISRVNGTLTYPCRFMLIAAMNPCKCGYYGSGIKPCHCSEESVRRYHDRISGPLLDRIDLHLTLTAVSYSDLHSSEKPTSSAEIRKRVCAARERQTRRFEGCPGTYCNAQMTPAMIREFCCMTPKGKIYLEDSFQRLHLSARAHDRILRVALTSADFDGRDIIDDCDLNLAVSYHEEF